MINSNTSLTIAESSTKFNGLLIEVAPQSYLIYKVLARLDFKNHYPKQEKSNPTRVERARLKRLSKNHKRKVNHYGK